MGQDHQRLDRLARAYTADDGSSDQAHLLAMYEALCQLPDYMRTTWPDQPVLHETWPEGTPERIMRALVAGGSHTFTVYNGRGDRITYRVGPLWRDEATGRVHWEWASSCACEQVDCQPSYADGMPVGQPYVRCPDGRWHRGVRSVAFGGLPGLEPDAPTPRQLRQWTVQAARARGEADLLARAVGVPSDAWVMEAPDHYATR